MSVLLVLGVVIVVVLAVLFIAGIRKEKKAMYITSFVLAAIMCLVLLFGPFCGTFAHTYRVVYHTGDKIVLVDDNNGNTRELDASRVTHTDAAYAIGDRIEVIDNLLGQVIFFAPDNTTITPSGD